MTAVVAVQAPSAAAPAASARTATAVAQDERTALRQALSTGSRVEVLDDRTAFTQVFAEPTGRLTYESTVAPQRLKQQDGSWRDIDLTLHSVDGYVRPAVSVADVRFSAGGSGPLVTMVEDGATFTVGWPGGVLPAPAVSGDSATYAEVLPGVDLVVRATERGFAHVLEVKNANAAANTALRQITFDLGGDARVRRFSDGSLQAVAGAQLLASATAPAMWDSRTSRPAPEGTGTAAHAAGAAAEPHSNTSSSSAGPGDAATVKAVKTGLTRGGDLILEPDAALLSSTADYPVFIDPAWSSGKSKWAYATSNNTNNSDTSVARVGKDPDSGKVYRSFFEFPTNALKAKHVESAYVQMKLDHSWSCTNTWTYMFHSNAIGSTPRTAWSTKLIARLSAAESHANEGSGCADSPQPDMTVNFTGSAVTSLIQSIADKSAAAVAVAFSAGSENGDNETSTDRWKKFFPGNAKLIADVDAKPAKPNNIQVNGVACTSAGISIGVTNPYFSAVFPDGDTGQSIKGTWEWYEVVNSTWPAKTAPAQTSAAANNRGTTVRVSGATNGKKYAVHAKGTDPAPYSITSGWSDWCYFTIDTTAPQVTATPITLPGGPGQIGTFQISSPATDVVMFRYGWNESVTNEIVAGIDPNVDGKTATITVTAPKYGINVLYLQAIDATKNKGYGSREFLVDRPTPAVARWGLEAYPGRDAAAALADGQPSLAGDTPLTATGAAWADDGRLVGGENLTFAGAGGLTTQTGVVDTTTNFGVVAQVKLDSLAGNQNIVSQDGAHVANFQLEYRSDDVNRDGTADKSWCFTMRTSDVDRAAFLAACAVNSAVAGQWTLVAGGYDAAARKLGVWVNGVQKAEVDAPMAWPSNGPVRIGNRKYTSSSYLDNLYGSVAQVQVFDRILVEDDFTGQLASDERSGGVNEPGMLQPVEVGHWDFEVAAPCYDTSIPETCEAPDVDAWGRRLALTQGTWIERGNQGLGAEFDNRHWIDDPSDPNYQKVTEERGTSQRNIAAAEQPVQWQDTPVLRTDQSFTVSVWAQAEHFEDGNSAVVSQRGTKQGAFHLGVRKSTINGVTGLHWAMATIDKDADVGENWTIVSAAPLLTDDNDAGEWTHLVGVYDAAAKELRLYVNGELAGSAPLNSLWNAAGVLSVGAACWSADNTTGAWLDQWFGGIDDLIVFQGALTGAQVLTLHDQQAAPEI
jgi:hypothetical protein